MSNVTPIRPVMPIPTELPRRPKPIDPKKKPRIKTAARHLESYKRISKVWLKSEIGAVIKFLNSKNYEHDMEVHGAIENLETYFEYGSCEERKITKEQSKFGIEYLRKRYYKIGGDPRKNCPFGQRETEIIRSFSKFRFVGMKANYNSMGSYRWFTPVYRVYSKNGLHFDYTAVHWGDPIVIG